jgi:predicted MPP superfamily phosphohydrolase
VDDDELQKIEARLGRDYARRRLALEREHEAQVFGQGLNFFHLQNAQPFALAVECALKLTGLYRRGCRNAERIVLRRNIFSCRRLPAAFDGFHILHLSDLHGDMSDVAMERAKTIIAPLSYDICVLTGDFRGDTFGPFDRALASLAELRAAIHAPTFAVLGNHDSARMVPGIEALGIRVLNNECETIERAGEQLRLAGIDDEHFYRAGDIAKAAASIAAGEFAILLSHTPEVYREAASAGFDLLLSGHTHGGQICLPGGIPLTLDAVLPRKFGRGAWQYQAMHGYTSAGTGSSVVPVRFNCPPEIALHTLKRAEAR